MAIPVGFGGIYPATQFAYGLRTYPSLTVLSGPSATGSGTLTLAFGNAETINGKQFTPLNTNAPISVGSGSSYETVTPTAVSTSTPNQYGTTTITATFANLHGAGDWVRSGTCGLQEALNFASLQGGGAVQIDAEWVQLGGTAAMVSAATYPSGVTLIDNRSGMLGPLQSVTVALTNAQLTSLNSAPVSLIAAPGAGSMIDVVDAVFNYVFVSAAMTSGGVLQLSYGSAITYPATATVPVAFFTSATGNQVIKVAGVLANTTNITSANFENKAIFINNATGNFAGSGTMSVVVNYRVINGLS